MRTTQSTQHSYLLSGVAAIAIMAATTSASVADATSLSAMWAGSYLGAHVGWGQAYTRMHPHSGETSDGVAKPNPQGIVGGIQGGHNWAMDSFVLGLEADITATDWSKTKSYPGNVSRIANHEVDWLASLRVRLGMPMDNALLFITGGLALANASYVGISPSGTRNTGNHNKVGGVVGMGADWRQNQNVSWRTEGLFYFFNNSKEFGSEDPGNRSKFRNALVLRVGGNYHFSDQRLKRDIEQVGHLENGLGLYRYRYLWSDQIYVGVMAQEVCQRVPQAVICDNDGYLRVDYTLLGTKLMTWAEWKTSSSPGIALAA